MNTPYTVISDLLQEIQVPEKGILSHTLYNDEKLKLILFGFAPGQELTAHTAPMPATIQFLQGEASLSLGSDELQVTSGALVHMPANLTHGIVAKSPVLMLLSLVKAARERQS
jgi:quercetin dioxygenase-like cupin family protein